MNDVHADMHCRDLLELDIQSHQVCFSTTHSIKGRVFNISAPSHHTYTSQCSDGSTQTQRVLCPGTWIEMWRCVPPRVPMNGLMEYLF